VHFTRAHQDHLLSWSLAFEVLGQTTKCAEHRLDLIASIAGGGAVYGDRLLKSFPITLQKKQFHGTDRSFYTFTLRQTLVDGGRDRGAHATLGSGGLRM